MRHPQNFGHQYGVVQPTTWVWKFGELKCAALVFSSAFKHRAENDNENGLTICLNQLVCPKFQTYPFLPCFLLDGVVTVDSDF